MKARRVPKLDPSRTLAENTARIARVRLAELRGFAADALNPDAEVAQHDMRIAAKRLRYVLEISGFCLGPPADRARRSSRALQEVLGRIHDCDVMLPRVAEHVERLREEDLATIRARSAGTEDLDPAATAGAPNRGRYRGLETLALHLRARRELLFERFRALWEREERSGTWKRLDRAAAETLKAEKARRKAGTEAAAGPPGVSDARGLPDPAFPAS